MSWSGEALRDSVQFIAEGIAELVGFGVAVISVRDGDEFVIAAVAGSAAGHRADGAPESIEDTLGDRWPAHLLLENLSLAEDWGQFKFVHHDHGPLNKYDEYTWVPDLEPLAGPDAWHPYDALFAPIYDADGVVQGVLSVDNPVTGRYPDAAERRVMDRYAEQAARAVRGALQEESLRQQARQVETAALLMRRATGGHTLEEVLAESAEDLLRAFGAIGIWSLVLDDDGNPVDVRSYAGPPAPTSPEIVELATTLAKRGWLTQEAGAIGIGEQWNLTWTMETDVIEAVVRSTGLGSIALTPVGAADRCLGALALLQPADGQPWTQDQLGLLFDIGRDLGQVLLNRMLLERERQATADLRRLDRYKSELIATVSHELKNPLAVLRGNVELLEEDLDAELPDAAVATAAVDRNARRMTNVIDDLLLLARVADPDTQLDTRQIDLRRVVRDALDALAPSAERAGVSITAELGSEPLTVTGDAAGLEGAVAHLVRNAVKFTDPGGAVSVELSPSGAGVMLTVSDTGIGISEADQESLFNEFFRSADPAARGRPGAGLGLAIVARVVARHEGEIFVESEAGRGSTFRIRLPL